LSDEPLEQVTKGDAGEVLGSGVTGDSDDPIWLNQAWKCSRCKTVHRFDAPAQIPAPCMNCGGVAFETIANQLH
jgi:hypothetical protein